LKPKNQSHHFLQTIDVKDQSGQNVQKSENDAKKWEKINQYDFKCIFSIF
jgi:hypothetical protein